jgi:Flp pilus assembly protein TadD
VPANDVERISVERLRLIRDIIDNSANTASAYGTKKILVDNFSGNYPGDPWTQLLQAQALYGSQQFSACAEAVHNNLARSPNRMVEAVQSTGIFLRGMCSMKAVTTATGAISERSARLQAAQRDMEAGASRVAEAGINADLADAARVASTMYQAICLFYRGDMATAHDRFIEAARSLTGSQRARALNNAGFAAFVLGRLEDARNDYNQAYEAQPQWLYIRANIAYLDMAEGRVSNALAGFRSVSADLNQRVSSPEDVRLARIMLLKLQHEEGGSLLNANRGYAELLHENSVPTWDFVVDPELRYAFLMHGLSRRIYLGGDYMGLEMFALAHICKAGELASGRPASSERGQVISLLRHDRLILRGRVSRFWLNEPHTGWLSHINRCSSLSERCAVSR